MRRLSFALWQLLWASLAVAADAPQPKAASGGVNDASDSSTAGSTDRVTHYAIVSTGPSGGALETAYVKVSQGIYDVLKQYGYPDEAIYRLSEFGITEAPHTRGRSTLKNFRAVFHHLAGILKPEDHVFIMIVGHGGPSGDHFVHPMLGGALTSTALKSIVDELPARDLTVVLHPCFSGGFLPGVSGPNRVIVTSTNDHEENACPWAETFVAGLSMNSKGAAPSIKDAYLASLAMGRRKYGTDLKEHPLLDDNGDGEGHYGSDPVVGGDGRLAASRHLGDNGRPLNFSAAAISRLAEANSTLTLSSRSKFHLIYAEESIFLAQWRGYDSDKGASSTSSAVHYDWAKDQPARIVADKLASKYLFQFDRQAGKGKSAADQFYGEASAHLERYGIDIRDAGRNETRASFYLDWAHGQTVPKLRKELERKTRLLMAAATDGLQVERS